MSTSDKFLTLENGRKKLKNPVVRSRGSLDAYRIVALNEAGKIDPTNFESGITAYTAIAGENLSDYDLVYNYIENGVLKVKKAIATSENTLADGYVKQGASSGAEVVVYKEGVVVASGLSRTPRKVFLSATQAGKVTQIQPSSGWFQEVGEVIDSTTFDFKLGVIIELSE